MKTYIHYGHRVFAKCQFKPIKNRIRWSSKPSGGFWASAIDDAYGWKQWCMDNNFQECTKNDSFTFTIRKGAKIVEIQSKEDLYYLPILERTDGIFDEFIYLDFEKLVKMGIDAIHVLISKDHRLYYNLYGWNCDSILIMNPDIIEEVKYE